MVVASSPRNALVSREGAAPPDRCLPCLPGSPLQTTWLCVWNGPPSCPWPRLMSRKLQTTRGPKEEGRGDKPHVRLCSEEQREALSQSPSLEHRHQAWPVSAVGSVTPAWALVG